ncbi:MAG: Crp/Fnr family transcriptional regulator [Solirubrobacterales bacterium]
MDISGFFPYPTVEAPWTLADLQFFPDGTEEEWSTLLSYTEMQLFDAGDTVMSAGDHGRALYLLTDGTLELVSRSRRSHPQLLTATTVFGEMSFLDGRPRSASLRARTDGEMLRLGREAYDALCAREPRLGQAVLLEFGRIVSLRLRRVEELHADAMT